MLKDTKTEKRFDIVFGIKNLVGCLMFTVVLLFLVSVIAVFVNFQEAVVSLLVSFVTYICVGICGFRLARHSGSNGLLSGAVAGFGYTILLYLIGCIAFMEFTLGTSALLTLAICVLCGAVGGVIGVNMKARKKR